MNLTSNNLKQSMENTIATIQSVLKRTLKCKYWIQPNWWSSVVLIQIYLFFTLDLNEKDSKNSVSNKELKLIQSLGDIQKPEVMYFGTIHKIE